METYIRRLIGILITITFAGYLSDSLRADSLPNPFVRCHLVPVNFPISEFGGDARFVESPSFERGTCWVILQEGEKCLLNVFSLPPDTRPYRDFPEPTTRVEVPVSIAKLVREIWLMAIMDVRYASKKQRGMDGTTYTFSTYSVSTQSIHGTTWSPEADGPPKWMVDAGHDVLAFARSSPKDTVTLERKLNEAKKKVSAYLNEKPHSSPQPNKP